MTRIAFLSSASLIFLSCAALPACGQQDEQQAVLSQCSNPLPRDVDSCLERARVQEETNPTPQMQALVGQLIQMQVRASEPPPPSGPVGDADHPVDDNGVSSYDTTPPEPPPSTDLGPLEPYQPPPESHQQDENPPDAQGSLSDMTLPDDVPSSASTVIQTTPLPPSDGSSTTP